MPACNSRKKKTAWGILLLLILKTRAEENDWVEILILIIHWVHGWGNVASNYYFSISSLITDHIKQKDLYITAWMSFGDAILESIEKLGVDIYNFSQDQVRRSDK